jgi:hypothetical protein
MTTFGDRTIASLAPITTMSGYSQTTTPWTVRTVVGGEDARGAVRGKGLAQTVREPRVGVSDHASPGGEPLKGAVAGGAQSSVGMLPQIRPAAAPGSPARDARPWTPHEACALVTDSAAHHLRAQSDQASMTESCASDSATGETGASSARGTVERLLASWQVLEVGYDRA